MEEIEKGKGAILCGEKVHVSDKKQYGSDRVQTQSLAYYENVFLLWIQSRCLETMEMPNSNPLKLSLQPMSKASGNS